MSTIPSTALEIVPDKAPPRAGSGPLSVTEDLSRLNAPPDRRIGAETDRGPFIVTEDTSSDICAVVPPKEVTTMGETAFMATVGLVICTPLRLTARVDAPPPPTGETGAVHDSAPAPSVFRRYPELWV